MPVDPNKVIQKRGPKCPKCQKPMVLRTNRHDRSQFWGCSQYPQCQGTYSAKVAQQVMEQEALRALQDIEEGRKHARSTPLPKKQTEDDELRALIAQRKKDSPW